MKMHEMKTAIINGLYISYFYTKEKPDQNGNTRFRVYIIDPDGSAVYETTCKTYEPLICDHVRNFIEEAQK
jgi:hypothetical protein